MSRNPAEYKRGRRDGTRWAIQWLHDEAKKMNDCHAKYVLNNAAFRLGVDAKQMNWAKTAADYHGPTIAGTRDDIDEAARRFVHIIAPPTSPAKETDEEK